MEGIQINEFILLLKFIKKKKFKPLLQMHACYSKICRDESHSTGEKYSFSQVSVFAGAPSIL